MPDIIQLLTTNRLLVGLGLLSLYIAIRIARVILHVYRCRQRWTDVPALPRHPFLGHVSFSHRISDTSFASF